MEDKNMLKNLVIKQFNDSNAIAYNKEFLMQNSDYEFKILDNAYQPTVKLYAQLKMLIKNNTCSEPNCLAEKEMLRNLEKAPAISVDFIQNIISELGVTEESNYDVNNDYRYAVANSIMTAKPGFSKTDGYLVELYVDEDGGQTLMFDGPMFEDPLVINNAALNSLLSSDTSLVVSTPDINKDMLDLLTKVGIFDAQDVLEDGTLSAGAMIKEEFILKNPDGSYDYEIIDIGNGKGRNILRFDLDKIERKIDPFINAEVSGLLSSEQDAVAAWNVYIAQGTSVEEDDQMVQNANAGSKSWSYEKDLPLSQDNKILFENKYKIYFMKNYLKQFITNKFPTVKEDAAVFDLEQARNDKAQKFIDDNNL